MTLTTRSQHRATVHDVRQVSRLVVKHVFTSTLIAGAGLILLPLSGHVDAAFAACVLEGDTYVCSEVDVRTTPQGLASTVAVPDIKVVLNPSYNLTNATLGRPNHIGLQVRAAPGHGDIGFTQEAGSSVVGGGNGLTVLSHGTGSTFVSLSGHVASLSTMAGTPAAYSVEVIGGGTDSGDITFNQREGAIEGASGALLVQSLGKGAISVNLAGDISGGGTPTVKVSPSNGTTKLSFTQNATSQIRGTAGSKVVEIGHSGSGQRTIDVNGAIIADAPRMVALDAVNNNSSEAFIVRQAQTGQIASTGDAVVILNRG